MLIRISGGSAGISNYLTFGQKSGRTQSREELDQRILLQGSLQTVDAILASFDPRQEHEKYMHITLSFKERVLEESVLQQIDEEFRRYIFAACRDDEFHYYSEAHLPKIKSLRDVNGSEYERYPHIHVVIPEYNLYTGKRDEPVGRINNITHYINAFQEMINEKYQLESPKDNVREISSGREGILNRHKVDASMTVQEIKEKIFHIVRENPAIDSVEMLAKAIEPLGRVRVLNSQRFGGKYINFALEGKAKAINLKDPVFLDAYLATRDIEVTRKFASSEHEALVARWLDYAALESRFVRNSSKKEREAYAEMSLEEKKNWLGKIRAKHEAMLDALDPHKSSDAPELKIELEPYVPMQPERDMDEIPDMDDLPHFNDIRHMDDIPHFEDLVHVTDLPFVYVKEEELINGRQSGLSARRGRENPPPAGEFAVHELRIRGGDGNRREGGDASAPDLLPPAQQHDLVGDEARGDQGLHALQDPYRISLAARYRVELKGQQEAPAWSAIIASMDTRGLLDYLQYHYGLDGDALQIEFNKNGQERIAAEGRRYSASDFLTRYMNLTWPEAREVLRCVHEAQERGEQRRDAVTSKMLWARFVRHEARLPGLSGIKGERRRKRHEIMSRLAFRAAKNETKAQGTVRRRLLREQRNAELARIQVEYEDAARYYRQRQHERYLQYLHEAAEQGDRAALGELNRIYPLHQSEPEAFEIHIRERTHPQRPFSPVEMGYSISIQKNGTVEYRDEQQQVVIVDTYSSIKVRERTADVIANALELARLRYGVNGFEIRNARQQDIEAIQAAADRTGIEVSVLSPGGTKELPLRRDNLQGRRVHTPERESTPNGKERE